VGVSFIFLPLVITSVNPVVDNLPLATNTIPGTNTNVQDFLVQHPKSVSFALAHSALLKLVQAHESVVLAASNNPSSANVDAVIAAIGEKNAIELNSLKAPFTSLVKPPGPAHPTAERRQAVAQPVEDMVLGLRGRHAGVHPDHLAQPGPVESGQSPG
jgi:hypothetical protein